MSRHIVVAISSEMMPARAYSLIEARIPLMVASVHVVPPALMTAGTSVWERSFLLVKSFKELLRMLGSPAQTIWTTQPRWCSSSGCNRSRVPAWMLHPTNVAEDRRHECLRLPTFLAGNGSQADFERHGQHFSSSEGKV